MVKDVTADFSDKEMRASLDVNIPSYASAVVTTDEIVEGFPSTFGLTQGASNAG
jgi:ureidoacrylate peracid hydrolase